MKNIIINAVTGEKKEIEVENPQKANEILSEPTLEERIKATEDAILVLLDMGVF